MCSIEGLWKPIDPARKVARTFGTQRVELFSLSARSQSHARRLVTRPSEGTRPEPTLAMVTRSRAWEGRGISVAPEAQIEPEVETRPEPEIATCEEGLAVTRSYPTNTGSLFTFSDKPELVTARTSQEVTETSLITAPSQTSLPHNTVPDTGKANCARACCRVRCPGSRCMKVVD